MKKILAVLFAMMMLIASIMPVMAQSETEIKAIPTKTYTSEDGKTSYSVNVIDEKSLQLYADAPLFTTWDSAVSYWREGMKNREATVEFKVSAKNPAGQYEEIYQYLRENVFMHTGNPKEGDYLESAFSSYESSISFSSSESAIVFTFDIKYKTTLKQETAVDEAVSKLLGELGVFSMNDYQKINTVYNYMCKNIKYDYTSTSDLKYTAYAALINKTSVCQGYATLAYRLLLEMGIDARMITGTSKGEGHAWNIVNLRGKYYNLDATWDSNTNSRTYFLKCNNDFSDHTRDAEFTTAQFNSQYPMASSNYVYNASLDAPNVTVKPSATLKPTVKPDNTPKPTETIDKSKPYIYFEPASLTLKVGEVADVTMYFGGGNEYECYELLLGYTLTSDNCKITSLSLDFGKGVEKLRITALREGEVVFTREMMNRDRVLLKTAALNIKVTNTPVATATPTPKPTATPTPKPTATPTPISTATPTVEPTQPNNIEPFIYFENEKIEIQKGEKRTVKVLFGGDDLLGVITTMDDEEACGYTETDYSLKNGYMVLEIEAKKSGRNAVVAELIGNNEATGNIGVLDVAMLEIVVYEEGKKPVDNGTKQPSVYYEEDEITLTEGETGEATLIFDGGDKYEWYDIVAITSRAYHPNICEDEGTIAGGFKEGYQKNQVKANSAGMTYILTRVYSMDGLMGYALLKLKVTPKGAVIEEIGDVNGDGKLNSRDIAVIQKHLTGIKQITDEKILYLADYNKDEKVNSRDIAAINKKILGL